MKKISKSQPPNALTKYAQKHSSSDWDNDFRDYKAGDAYKNIKKLIFLDQGYLCAYCESQISENMPDKQRVEHFHPKSDKSDPAINWALDWDNVIGVCCGGEDVDKSKHALPANLSCDSYKNHLIIQRKLTEACEGYLLNPLQMPAFPCLFALDKRTGEFKPDLENCVLVFADNRYATTAELIEKTITSLNLNCDRLNQQRLAVLHRYEQQVKKARQQNDRNVFSKLAAQWFQSHWPGFFTTRRILLGHHAETYLQNLAYNG